MTVSKTWVRPNEYDPLSNLWNGAFRLPHVRHPAMRGPTAHEQETDDRMDDGCENSGNPVVLYTGNKVEDELDFSSEGEMGLYLQRTYNHHWTAAGIFGHHWISNLDYSLAFSAGSTVAWLQRPDGRRLKLVIDPATGRWNEDRAEARVFLTRQGDGSYVLFNEARGSERYDADGYILSRSNEQGIAWHFEYRDKLLRKVTHSSGRALHLEWRDNQMIRITDPSGSLYHYTYASNVFGNGGHRLTSTTLPGTPATTVHYHYDDARHRGGLTGKSYNGVRYSTFAYDADGRAISSEHAGGVDRHTFEYRVEHSEPVGAPPSPPRPGGKKGDTETGWCEYRPGWGTICFQPSFVVDGAAPPPTTADGHVLAGRSGSRTRAVKVHVTETNPLGRRTTYTYHDGRQVSVTGAASPLCAASYKERSYDANGNPDLVHDFENNLTDFDYNAKGQLTRQVEAVGTSAQRTTTLAWDAATHRLNRSTIEGVAETTYGYDARGNLASTSVRNLSPKGIPNQTLTTQRRYTHHSNGLIASLVVDGPLPGDDVTYRYSERGDLLSVSNALGHATTYGGHNALGQPGSMRGPNGDRVEFTYDGRGRVLTRREHNGVGWATTTLAYNESGSVAQVTLPDGVTVSYDHDAARRLLADVRSLGDGRYAWTRHTYDAASNLTGTQVVETDYSLQSSVVGNVDGITHAGDWQWYARGWACITGSKQSIQVAAYVDGGPHLSTVVANRASEPQVAAACGSTGSAYRYTLPITLSQRHQFGGRPLVVHGLSPRGAGHNRVLANSGVFKLPPAKVIGSVERVTHDGQWNYFVEGWACQVGTHSPIDVHLYVGGAAGTGIYMAQGTSNRASEEGISRECQSKGRNHRFRIPLGIAIREVVGGRSIHIHGISVVGNGNTLLAGAGAHAVPPVTRTANLLRYDASPDWILNGERSTLTLQLRNSGNVIWDGGTRLRHGSNALEYSRPLPQAVAPGQVATFQWQEAPTHHGPATARRYFHAQLSDRWGLFGPKPVVQIMVENQHGYCPPVGPCHEPIRIPMRPGIILQEGEG